MPTINDDFEKRLTEQMQKSKPPSAPGAPGVPPASAAKAAAGVGVTPQSAEKGAAGPVGQGDHIVRGGECVASIAKQTGHFWQTIWDEPANSDLKTIRKQPNVLLDGDRITIPELRPKEDSGQTEMRHRFKRRGEPSHLRIRVLDQDKPMASMPYKLVIDGKQTIEGMLDAEGVLDVPIPGNAKKGELGVGDKEALASFPKPTPEGAEAGKVGVPKATMSSTPSKVKASSGDEAGTTKGVASGQIAKKDGPQNAAMKVVFTRFSLNLGGLAPVETWGGVQQRLSNMGIHCDKTDKRDDQTMDAVNEFRARSGRAPADDLDEETRQEILAKHGS
jgi:hypothetical protein